MDMNAAPVEKKEPPEEVLKEYSGQEAPKEPVQEQRVDIVEAEETEERKNFPAPVNFRITDDDLGAGGPKQKFRANMEAILLLKKIEGEHRSATPEEQDILSRYVGWGGLRNTRREGRLP